MMSVQKMLVVSVLVSVVILVLLDCPLRVSYKGGSKAGSVGEAESQG